MMRWVAGAALAAATALAIPAAHAAGAMVSPAVYSWTSCYVGGNVGPGWDQTNVVDEVEGYPIASLSSGALVGGGQIGCDYQVAQHWVIGLQGLWDATGLSASYTETNSEAPLYPSTLTGSVPWVATFTGRIGYLLAPDWMIYAKGGLAWNRTNSALLYEGTTLDSVSFNQTGWTAGIGAEWRQSQHWSFFAEYNYLGFGSQNVYYPNTSNAGTVKQNIQAVLFGVNLHFN
jgi:outer membrane immunogenic protein